MFSQPKGRIPPTQENGPLAVGGECARQHTALDGPQDLATVDTDGLDLPRGLVPVLRPTRFA